MDFVLKEVWQIFKRFSCKKEMLKILDRVSNIQIVSEEIKKLHYSNSMKILYDSIHMYQIIISTPSSCSCEMTSGIDVIEWYCSL